jgi:GT2 family glycosyltransferase
MLQNVQAIVVIYNIDFKESQSLVSIQSLMVSIGNTLDVLIYDNSTESQEIDHSFFNHLKIEYVSDITNNGLSFAYNFGNKFALENKKEWLLILDQDTIFESNYFTEFINQSTLTRDIKLYCPQLYTKHLPIFSPCQYKNGHGVPPRKILPGINFFKNFYPVNSGIIVSTSVFEEVGGYNPDLKLDFSDFQFIDRLKEKYAAFYLLNSKGFQDFSDDERNTDKVLNRFKYFCNGIAYYQKKTMFQKIQLYIFGFKRALVLFLRTKSLSIFTVYFLYTFRFQKI